MEELDILREKIDELFNKVKLRSNSIEMDKCFNSLRLAKAWLGKVKGSTGAKTPYKVVDSLKDIPPTAEVSLGVHYSVHVFPPNEHKLLFVNTVRELIQQLILEVQDMLLTACGTFEYLNYCKKELETARFYLGFELANIREKKSIRPPL